MGSFIFSLYSLYLLIRKRRSGFSTVLICCYADTCTFPSIRNLIFKNTIPKLFSSPPWISHNLCTSSWHTFHWKVLEMCHCQASSAFIMLISKCEVLRDHPLCCGVPKQSEIGQQRQNSEKYIANVCQISPKVTWPRLHSRKHQHRMNANIGFIVCIVLPFTDMCMQKDCFSMLITVPLSITLQALKMCSKKVHGAKSKEIQKQKVVFQNLSKSVLWGWGYVIRALRRWT